MSTFVIGDLHGCLSPLQALLKKINFHAGQDQLWQVGDLVNRGPESAQILRFMRGLGASAISLLGNHDLSFLAMAAGAPIMPKPGDTSFKILDEPDADELVDWLRHRPLMYAEKKFAMVHAGLLPDWSIAQAMALAAEVQTALQSKNWKGFLCQLFGNKPDCWHDNLKGNDRLRVIVNAMTRMRLVTPEGVMQMKHKGTLEAAPPHLLPWFNLPNTNWRSHTILCGHWSALGFKDMGNVIALDSGCVWGRELTALRLEDHQVFQVDCPTYASIGNID